MPFAEEAWSPESPYITAEDLFADGCGCSWDANDPDQVEKANTAVGEASSVLYLLSARTLGGLRTQTIFPTRMGSCTYPKVHPEIGACPGSVVVLDAPVNNVTTIWIDGVEVPDDEWRVINYRYLVRLSGEDGHIHWPERRSDLVVDGEGSFALECVWGTPAPPFTAPAALELSCIFMQSLMGERVTVKGLQSISVSGSSYSRRQTAEAVKNSVSELPTVERFIGLINPGLQQSHAVIMSPDISVGGPRIT